MEISTNNILLNLAEIGLFLLFIYALILSLKAVDKKKA